MTNIYSGLAHPIKIFQTTSSHNNKIEVYQKGDDFLKLVVNDTIQSVNASSKMAGKMFWGKIIEVINQNHPNFHHGLFLGLGGGTTQTLASKTFHSAHLYSIEIDEEIIKIAKQFFGIDNLHNHSIIHEDALRFVVEYKNHGFRDNFFDLAVIDLYLGDLFPSLASSGTFLNNLKQLLHPDSLVIFNRIYLDDHQEEVNQYIEFLSEYFKNIQHFTVAGKTNSDHIIIYGRV